jgi:hypothetical protein
MMLSALLVELWLLIFDYLSDHDVLWSIARNVSSQLRVCIDEYFRCAIVPNTLVALHYSTIHSYSGLWFARLRILMQFIHFSTDCTRAVFRQVRYKDPFENKGGSVRGWVPFFERDCREARKPHPRVLNKSKCASGPPIWERDHRRLLQLLQGTERAQYLAGIRNHTSQPHWYRDGIIRWIRATSSEVE